MKNELEKEKKVYDVLSEIYIFIILVIFPLYVDQTGFFHILECKWSFFVISTCIFLISTLFVYLYFLIFHKVHYYKNFRFGKIQIFALIFLGFTILSYVISPFRKTHDLFIGVGRGEGLLVSSLYILSFLVVSMIGQFKKRYLSYFIVSFFLLNVVAVLQFLGFNPFYMYQYGIGIHNVSFLTTIGNIDFVSALYCILLSISFSCYVFFEEQKTWEKVLQLSSIFMGFMMIAIMQVASGKLGPFVTLVLIIPFILTNNKRFSRFVTISAIILLAYGFNLFINPQYHYDVGHYGLYINFNYVVVLFAIVGIILLFLARVLYHTPFDSSKNKKIIIGYYSLIVLCGVLSLVVLYFYTPHIDMLYEIHEILHGNLDDNFGTYRIFLWRRTLKIIPDYFWFGVGPDGFAIPFMERYTADIAAIGELTINDTAANIYLTMFVNLGVFGILSYLIFLGAQIKKGISQMNPYSMVLLIAIVCYSIQAFFNLSVVIISPIFWILLALHECSCSTKNKKHN